MADKVRTDQEKEIVELSDSASDSKPTLDTSAARPLARDVAQENRGEEPQPVSRPEKAMAATTPGTEYWWP